MKLNDIKSIITPIRLLLGAMIIIFLATLLGLVENIDALHKNGMLHFGRASMKKLADSHTPTLQPTDLRPWMTFDYINHSFKLPPEYLKTSLKITQANYARLTIYSLARIRKSNVDILVQQIQSLIPLYKKQ